MWWIIGIMAPFAVIGAGVVGLFIWVAIVETMEDYLP